MQISSANLLAAQTQTARPRAAGAAFEPIAFKSAPPTAPVKSDPKAAETSPAASLLASPDMGYVRPGTNLDIKI